MPRAVDVQDRLRLVQDAVVAIAARDGFGAVTVRRVAAEAGASTSVVTHYVASRDELVRSTIVREVSGRQDLLQAATADKAADAALRALVRSAVLGTDQQSHRFWLAIVLGSPTDLVLRMELQRFNNWWDDLVQRFISALDRPPQDRATLLDAVAVITDGMIISRFEQDQEWSLHRCERTLDVMLEPLLR